MVHLRLTVAGAMFLDPENHPTVGFGTQTTGGVGEVEFATWDGTGWQTTTYATIDLPSSAGANVDAIAIAPIDRTAMVSVVERAAREKIPVVIFDSGINTQNIVAQVSTDN